MRKIVLLLTLVAWAMLASAQEKPLLPTYNNALGYVPQYMITGGLRIDYDRRLNTEKNQWVIASPSIYWITGYRLGHEIHDLKGIGLDLKHRVFVTENKNRPRGFYFEYGPTVQLFEVTDVRDYVAPYEENGIQYYTIVNGEYKTRLTKVGVNLHIGYQGLIGQKIYYDLYAGPGIRLSFDNRNPGFTNALNDIWIDYGYSGTLLDGGVRVGFLF